MHAALIRTRESTLHFVALCCRSVAAAALCSTRVLASREDLNASFCHTERNLRFWALPVASGVCSSLGGFFENG
jgi:hypothetical protein